MVFVQNPKSVDSALFAPVFLRLGSGSLPHRDSQHGALGPHDHIETTRRKIDCLRPLGAGLVCYHPRKAKNGATDWCGLGLYLLPISEGLFLSANSFPLTGSESVDCMLRVQRVTWPWAIVRSLTLSEGCPI